VLVRAVWEGHCCQKTEGAVLFVRSERGASLSADRNGAQRDRRVGQCWAQCWPLTRSMPCLGAASPHTETPPLLLIPCGACDLYPTGTLPTCSPRSAATRCARPSAEIRLGCVTCSGGGTVSCGGVTGSGGGAVVVE